MNSALTGFIPNAKFITLDLVSIIVNDKALLVDLDAFRELQEVGLLPLDGMLVAPAAVAHETPQLPSPEYATDLAQLLAAQRMSSSPLVASDDMVTPPRPKAVARKDSGLSPSGRPSLAAVKSRTGSGSNLLAKPGLLATVSRTGSASSLGMIPWASCKRACMPIDRPLSPLCGSSSQHQ